MATNMILGNNKTQTINREFQSFTVIGNNNKVIIKSQIRALNITGNHNEINGLDPNCLIHFINACGNSNKINLNQRCSNATKNMVGNSNTITFNNNYIRNTNNVINNNNTNYNNNNANYNNNNVNYNNNNANNHNNNGGNLSEYDKKKKQLILEMDEYQYKHIQKYNSRKETKCVICLNEFLGLDIIKAFYKCEHIFHKVCLLDWLKKSDSCPLCKHNLKDDIK